MFVAYENNAKTVSSITGTLTHKNERKKVVIKRQFFLIHHRTCWTLSVGICSYFTRKVENAFRGLSNLRILRHFKICWNS